MKIFKSLYFQVVLAIIAGALLGHFLPTNGTALKPLGDGFIRLIKMLIAPVIFCTVVTGIAHIRDTRKVGRMGIKALLYFEVVTTLALIIGLLVINWLKPGNGMHINAATIDGKAVQQYVTQSTGLTWQEFLLNIIPETVVQAFAGNSLLQVLLFSVLLGLALIKIGNKAQPLLAVLKKRCHICQW